MGSCKCWPVDIERFSNPPASEDTAMTRLFAFPGPRRGASEAGSLGSTRTMRSQPFIISLVSLFMIGCAHTQPKAHLLASDEIQPGSTYEVGMYVLARGDSVAAVCRRFRISVRDFEALNPGLDPTHPLVGQRVKIYERLRD